MPTLYDSTLTYDSVENYDFLVDYALIRKDLYAQRGSDNTFNMVALAKNTQPLDLTGYTLSGRILEYWGTNKVYAATYTVTNFVGGQYTISIDDTVALNRPRYVYEVFAVSGLQRIKIHMGQILVE
jgi:hypothetical protein